MAFVGRGLDRIAGSLSHLLHVRAARHNTVEDLGPYLGAPLSVLFPAPAVPRDVVRTQARLPRSHGRVLETLRWHSQHVPLCPHYRSRHAGEYAGSSEELTPVRHDWAEFSPDGRGLLFRSGSDSSASLHLTTVPPGTTEKLICSGGCQEGHWRGDSREIYFIVGGAMRAQEVQTKNPTLPTSDSRILFSVPGLRFAGRNSFVVTPDGERFLIRT